MPTALKILQESVSNFLIIPPHRAIYYTAEMKPIPIPELKERIAAALRKFPVSFAYLYGSYAAGAVHRESDIDIAVAFSSEAENTKEDLLLDVLAAVNEKLPVPTEKLDVQNFEALPLALQFRIVREGQLFYLVDIKSQRQLVLKVISRYHDERRFFQKATRAFLERAATKR